MSRDGTLGPLDLYRRDVTVRLGRKAREHLKPVQKTSKAISNGIPRGG